MTSPKQGTMETSYLFFFLSKMQNSGLTCAQGLKNLYIILNNSTEGTIGVKS